MSIKCPADGANFAEEKTKFFSYDECTQCSGIWIGPESLAQLRGSDYAVSFPSHSYIADKNMVINERGLVCPLDGTVMHEFEYTGVLIDICSECDGIWLDANELNQIKTNTWSSSQGEKAVENALEGTYVLAEFLVYLARFLSGG